MLSESALMASSTLQSAISCSICRKSIIIGAKLRNKTKISKTVRLQGLGKAVKKRAEPMEESDSSFGSAEMI